MTHFESAEARRFEYGDPLAALIRAESKTCKGCVWGLGRVTLGDEALCAKDRLMRKRCGMYIDSNHYTKQWRIRNATAS